MSALAIILTVAYLVLNMLVWKRTRSRVLLAVQVILYFYTFHIYGIVLLHEFGLYDRKEHLFGYPYYAAANEALLYSFAHYGVFSIIYLGMVLIFAPQPMGRAPRPALIELSPWPLIALNATCFAIAVVFWSKELLEVFNTGLSGYLTYKNRGGVAYPVIRILCDLSCAASLLLFSAILGLSRNVRLKAAALSTAHRGISVALLLSLALMLGSFGDKSSLIFGLIFAACVTLASEGRLAGRTLLSFSLLLISMNTITILRHNPENLGVLDLLTRSVSNFFDHAEAVSALSQYALVSNGVEATNGRSIYFLFRVLVPQFILPERPADPYDYYSFNVGLQSGTGWGMHYATDWYMNFGILGIVLGAVILGCCHGYLFRKSVKSPLWLFIFSGLVASYPLSIRSGISGIKGNILGALMGWIIFRIGFAAQNRLTPRSAEGCGSALGKTRPTPMGRNS